VIPPWVGSAADSGVRRRASISRAASNPESNHRLANSWTAPATTPRPSGRSIVLASTVFAGRCE
jgi:hypothetical protein